MQANSAQTNRTETANTLGYPRWLLIATAVLLPVRLALVSIDHAHDSRKLLPVQLSAQISPVSGKPKLFVFLRDDGTMSRRLWEAIEHNRDLSQLIARNFDLIKIVDTGVGDSDSGKFFKRYSVYNLPTVVAALPDGTRVRDFNGFTSAQVTYEFLKAAIKEENYILGKELLRKNDYAGAADKFSAYADATESSAMHYEWAQFYRMLCLLRLNNQSQARAVSQQCVNKLVRRPLTYPMFLYMSGKASAHEMLNDEVYTESAHTVLACKLLAEGSKSEALTQFMWVRAHAPKDSFEFCIAAAALDKEFGMHEAAAEIKKADSDENDDTDRMFR